MCKTHFPFDQTRAEGLLLRKATEGDQSAYIELSTDAHVRFHLGGPVPIERLRARLESRGAPSITADPGSFVIADGATDELLGLVSLDRRSSGRPGHITKTGNELELSYLLRRGHWGRGISSRAASLLLKTAAQHFEDQPVLVVTQMSNEASLALARRLGFEHAATFTEFGAEQWLGVRGLHQPPRDSRRGHRSKNP